MTFLKITTMNSKKPSHTFNQRKNVKIYLGVFGKTLSKRFDQSRLWYKQAEIFVLLFSAYKNDSGRNRRTDLYLKENEHLRR